MLGIFFVFFFVENCVYLEVSRKNEFITVFIVYAMFMIRNMVRVLSSVRVYAICLCCCVVVLCFFFLKEKRCWLPVVPIVCIYLQVRNFSGMHFRWVFVYLYVIYFPLFFLRCEWS